MCPKCSGVSLLQYSFVSNRKSLRLITISETKMVLSYVFKLKSNHRECLKGFKNVSIIITRVNELTMLNEKLKIQLEEKDKSVGNLQRSINNLETRLGEQRSFDIPENEAARQYREETDTIHEALRNIAEAVINDADEVDAEGRSSSPYRARSTSPSARARSPILRNRSKSPGPRSRSPAFADATFSAVQAALNKRQLQVSELRAKVIAGKDHNGQLRKNLDDAENERRRLEMQIINLKEDLDLA